MAAKNTLLNTELVLLIYQYHNWYLIYLFQISYLRYLIFDIQQHNHLVYQPLQFHIICKLSITKECAYQYQFQCWLLGYITSDWHLARLCSAVQNPLGLSVQPALETPQSSPLWSILLQSVDERAVGHRVEKLIKVRINDFHGSLLSPELLFSS